MWVGHKVFTWLSHGCCTSLHRGCIAPSSAGRPLLSRELIGLRQQHHWVTAPPVATLPSQRPLTAQVCPDLVPTPQGGRLGEGQHTGSPRQARAPSQVTGSRPRQGHTGPTQVPYHTWSPPPRPPPWPPLRPSSVQVPSVRVAVAVHVTLACAARSGALQHVLMHG